MSRIDIMAAIMNEKDQEIAAEEQLPLDAEGAVLAEDKRESFDQPINVAKSDPLR